MSGFETIALLVGAEYFSAKSYWKLKTVVAKGLKNF